MAKVVLRPGTLLCYTVHATSKREFIIVAELTRERHKGVKGVVHGYIGFSSTRGRTYRFSQPITDPTSENLQIGKWEVLCP